MNDDYLWDKAGDGAGVRELEEKLTVFRYTAQEPPSLPAIGIRAWLPSIPALGFGFAAILATGLIGIWVLRPAPESITHVISEPSTQNELRQNEKTGTSLDRNVTIAAAQPTYAASTPSTRVGPGSAGRKPSERVRRPRPRTQTVKLSKEEQYAYDQVVLALSITSEKLKIVQDQIHERPGQGSPKDNRR